MDPIHARLIENIRKIAEERGLVVTNLPALARVGRSHYWEVMGGRRSPTLGWIARVAAALDVDPAELLREPKGHRS